MEKTDRHSVNRAMRQQLRQQKQMSLFDRAHALFYLGHTDTYIGIAVGSHWLAKIYRPVLRFISRISPPKEKKEVPQHSVTQATGTIADTYHGKALPLDVAKELITVKENIKIDDLEHVIPYVDARVLILDHPDHIVVLDCPCRSNQENPCLPIDVCLVIGEPFASYTVANQPDKSRWITTEEALEILEAEEKRGHVHHAFFKDVMLGRFYAICNCCSCCCSALYAHRNGVPMLSSSGYLAEINVEECVGCGICESACIFEAISVVDGLCQIDEATCMGCGVCTSKCPKGALSLRLAPEKGVPFELDKLMEEAVQAA